jgi:pantetheine-phosphate adenylyltransferase
VAAVGGTFDYLHIGHQILLLYTMLAAKETIYVGVAGEPLLINKKYKELIQPLALRIKTVRDFLKSINR